MNYRFLRPAALIAGAVIVAVSSSWAQRPMEGPAPKAPLDPIVEAIIKEATEHSQLEILGRELMDGIGPRLVGSPKMKEANDWAIKKYESWNIPARNEQWGEWRGWERGTTHIDMLSPWVKSLAGTQLAWSPSTKGKAVTGDVIILPDLADSLAFQQWLPQVKGKFVMISMLQPTGRPDHNWEEFGKKESVDRMKSERDKLTEAWNARIKKTGKTIQTLPLALEKSWRCRHRYKLLVTRLWCRQDLRCKDKEDPND
ncbi:MAG: hypothetical protein QM762_24275 [Chryseolinea sp.]